MAWRTFEGPTLAMYAHTWFGLLSPAWYLADGHVPPALPCTRQHYFPCARPVKVPGSRTCGCGAPQGLEPHFVSTFDQVYALALGDGGHKQGRGPQPADSEAAITAAVMTATGSTDLTSFFAA